MRSPFVSLLRVEFGRVFGPRQAIGFAAVSLMGILLAFWLPTFPDSVFLFFQDVFQLRTWTEIVLANDLVGAIFFLYWLAVFDVLAIYIVPLEQRYLDLFLSKSLSRRAYMLARVIPVMVVLTALGMACLVVHWLALCAAGLDFPLSEFISLAAVVVAWTVLLVSVANIVVLTARDSYTATLLAFLVIAASMLPGSVYMYRPDMFADAPLARAVLVFPLTLLWHLEFVARWGVCLAILSACTAVALIAVSGQNLQQRDVE